MIDFLTEIQKQVYSRLIANTSLQTYVVARVYDNLPQEEVFPYVVIGNDEIKDRSSHTTNGVTATIEIRCWTQEQRSFKQAKEILHIIFEELHDKVLNISGSATVTMRRDMQTCFLEDDNETIQGIIRLEAFLSEDI